jgi:hypothetical protein
MTSKNEIPQIGPQQLDAVLRFLPIFERPGYAFGEWRGPQGHFPYYAMSRDVEDFIQTLYNQQVIIAFDWMSWHQEVKGYVSDPDALQSADLLTLRKLLTAHVRADRLNEGHLGHVLESGHITAILRRVKTLREEMEAGES